MRKGLIATLLCFMAMMGYAQQGFQNRIYDYLVDKGIIVRNRNSVNMCGNCLRITIGTKEENTQLLSALRVYKQ